MKGSFTLPGEAGYEALTLRLAEKWGADVIRDSDGTQLSSELLDAGYAVYSTICLIRSINDWAKQHPRMLQQNFLMSRPVSAVSGTLQIDLLAGYSRDQFRINDDDGMEYWQVIDRTTGEVLSSGAWTYDAGFVTIPQASIEHRYTVNFFAYRIWEAISMYNHITNGWGDKERLMPVEPRHPEVQQELLRWLRNWCETHPETDVVRFTSLFYNFAWIWSDDPKARDIYSDWGSYDFSVNPVALRLFEQETGIHMTSEDFIHADRRNSTHQAPTDSYRAWMAFTHRFVADFGRRCVELVQEYGKQAYVFYDDSWIGLEPYGPHFPEIGFDGVIKCVFGGYETRLCANVPAVKTREIRLHPYLFPTGLQGEPTFAPGGNPTPELYRYWLNVRRALLRQPVDRMGLGGYLHLVEPFEDFIGAVAEIADVFRAIKALHQQGTPKTLQGKIMILTAWGDLRTWSTSGHLHEHPEIDLTHLLEALSGLPVEVVFASLEDIRSRGIPADVKVLINAGWAGSAWSGGEAWQDAEIVTEISHWVHQGGGLIGIGEPSACEGFEPFALGSLFGVQRDDGSRKCMRKYQIAAESTDFFPAEELEGLVPLPGVYQSAPDTKVVLAHEGSPVLSLRRAGEGRALYLSGYRYSARGARLILRALCWAGGAEDGFTSLTCTNPETECAVFQDRTLVVNNSPQAQQTRVPGFEETVSLPPYGQVVLKEGTVCALI